jgi:hypothetical protein
MSDDRTLQQQQQPEVPIIIIERDDEPQKGPATQPERKKPWLRPLAIAAGIAGAVVVLLVGYHLYRHAYGIGITVSCTPAQNIEKLKAPVRKEKAAVVKTSDSILGVALDFYALNGLTASVQFEEPDTADASVYLYSRCADHRADETYIGTLIAEGRELQSDRSRLGYMGMADGRMVIGISRSDEVKDYVVERGGSFFRQFILVSNSEIPARFFLHGKVERRAIGRKGDTLYYIATRHKETLWDFADALREYGFIDAIYITGGTDYCFYRTRDGVRHNIGDSNDYPHKKWAGVIPWLVFRKAQ